MTQQQVGGDDLSRNAKIGLGVGGGIAAAGAAYGIYKLVIKLFK